MWEHAAPAGPEWHASYKGVTVDAEGTIYVVGAGQHTGDPTWRLLLEALAMDGTPLWQVEAASPVHMRVEPSGIVVTSGGMLVVAGAESHENTGFTDDPGLAAFDTTGALLWWKTWPAPELWNTSVGRIAALPNFGGVVVAWGHSQEDIRRTRVARYDTEGEVLWEIESDSQTHPLDAALGPDKVFYVLEGRSVRSYLP
jgi:outer membrane protein assembly factor BamB